MSFAPRSVLAALAYSASVAFAQTPAFTVVNHGLDATFGKVGKGIYVQIASDAQQTISTQSILPVILTIDAAAAPTPPSITTQPAAQNAVAGGTATFSVALASSAGATYQWQKDGVNIAGATSATLTLNNVSAVNTGSYTVIATNSVGSITSAAATLQLVTASNTGRLVNMSIRTSAGSGDNTLIVGVGLGGAGTSGSKAVLLRGIGPTLTTFGVGGALADPVMTAFQGSTQIAQNDDWAGGFDFSTVGAFALTGVAPRDAAIYNAAIPSGSYSVQITGKNNATGIALAEIYDATPTTSFAATTPRLVNVSARTSVGTGDNIPSRPSQKQRLVLVEAQRTCRVCSKCYVPRHSTLISVANMSHCIALASLIFRSAFHVTPPCFARIFHVFHRRRFRTADGLDG